jgi:Sulfotransferase domain
MLKEPAERTAGETHLESREMTLANGRRISFEIARQPGRQAFFVLGVRKSGSSILSKITRALTAFNRLHFFKLKEIFFDQNVKGESWLADPAIVEMIAEGNVYGAFRAMPSAFSSNELFRSSKKVLMVRDPRDALVSQYFSNAFSHPIPQASSQGDEVTRLMTQQRERALRTSLDGSVINGAASMNETLLGYAGVRDDPNTLLFKYEDVILDKKRLIEGMCVHFGWNITEKFLDHILSWADVFPETEDKTAFVRKVVPGDHREKLSPETISKLNRILKPSMDLFGYDAV